VAYSRKTARRRVEDELVYPIGAERRDEDVLVGVVDENAVGVALDRNDLQRFADTGAAFDRMNGDQVAGIGCAKRKRPVRSMDMYGKVSASGPAESCSSAPVRASIA
jgi:hypothetical protein